MLRVLSNNHPFTYAFLFILAFVLRAPSFHSEYFSTDESLYMVSAMEIVEGGTQYADTWDNKPPVIVWFYAFFAWIFGGGALLAIRIFTCIYLFVAAVLLNQLVDVNRLLNKFSLFPAFLFLILCSVPWYAQELNAEMLMTLPIILAWYQMFRMGDKPSGNNGVMLLAGLLMGLSFMIKYQAAFLFLGMIVAYLIAFTPRIHELVSLVGGFVLSVFGILTAVYFSGSLGDFWEIGFLYNFDYIVLGANPGEQISMLGNLWQYTQLWGVFIILSAFGIAWYRLNYFSNTIRLRKAEIIILAWYLSGLLTIIVGSGRLYLHYFVLLIPPLTVYVTKFFEFGLQGWLKTIVLSLGLAIPIFTYGVYLVSVYPSAFSFVDSWIAEDGWIAGFRKTLNEPHPLAGKINPENTENGILVLNMEPELYLRLGVPVATRYTNFSLFYYKVEFLPHNKGQSLLSGMETTEEVFRQLRDDPPDCFVDSPEFSIVPILKEKFPLLLANYEKEKVGPYDLYFRN